MFNYAILFAHQNEKEITLHLFELKLNSTKENRLVPSDKGKTFVVSKESFLHHNIFYFEGLGFRV